MYLFDLALQGIIAEDVPRRAMNAMAREAMMAACTDWHQNIRDKHFRMAAFTEYGYQPRSGKYTKTKRWKKHHGRPLVFSGESEARTKTARIHATATAAVVHGWVTMDAPALNFQPRGWTHPIRDELTRFNDRDRQEVTGVYNRIMSAALAGYRKTSRKRLK